MKLVIQRVKQAKVSSRGEIVGQIGKGYFVLLGVGKSDKSEDAVQVAEKLVNLRIMSDDQDKMNLSIKDASGEILLVSQFTLYANTSGGRRPSFVNAAPPDLAREVYEELIKNLREMGVKVEAGSFGNYMEIEAVADGPVTIVIDTELK